MSNWFSEEMPNEVPFSEIEARSDEFHSWNFVPETMQEIGYESINEKLRTYTAERYEALDDAGKEALVKEVLALYRSIDLLPIQYYSDLGVMNEIEKCIAYKAAFEGDTVSCVDGETEYFNGVEWKKISSYTEGDKVLQYNEDGTATLTKPLKYISYSDKKPFYEYVHPDEECSNFHGMCLTGNHNVVYIDERGKCAKIPLIDLMNVPICDLEDGCYDIPESCVLQDSEYSVDEDEVTLALTALAFKVNDRNLCTKYSYVEEDRVMLSDKVYTLSLKSRRYLLKCFGIYEDTPYIGNIEGVLAEYATPENKHLLIKAYKKLINLVNVTYEGNCNLCYDPKREKYYVSFDEDFNGYHVLPHLFKEVLDDKKYCFTVESGMLVVRRKNSVFITGNCGAGVGTTLCNYLFPNLFDVPSQHDLDKKGAETLFAKFHNDEYLSKAIKFCFSYKNGCPTPTNVMGGLRLVGSAPTNFRPMNAKAVYERFCPEGGTVYDFCCGFGGRMLGCLSSKKNFRYVGTDPCTETMYHLHELGDYIEMVTGRDDSYELHCCGSEDFCGPAESIDFAFSSPPYFNLEVYSDEETQCFNKFPVLEDWLEGYVRATIKNIHHMLKRGTVYAVNIADFTVGGGKECAYVDEWIRISTEEGMPLYDTVYLGVTARAGSKQQAAGELKKENILIFKKPL